MLVYLFDRFCLNFPCCRGHSDAAGQVPQHVERKANKVISLNLHSRAIGAELHQQRANEAARVSWSWRDVNLSRHLNEYSTFDAKIERARGRRSENESRSLSSHSACVWRKQQRARAVGRMAFVMWCCIICIDKSHPHAVGGLVYITRERAAPTIQINPHRRLPRPPLPVRVSFTREAASAIWCNNISLPWINIQSESLILQRWKSSLREPCSFLATGLLWRGEEIILKWMAPTIYHTRFPQNAGIDPTHNRTLVTKFHYTRDPICIFPAELDCTAGLNCQRQQLSIW